ncbi:uncharacterized protein LOC119559677 [Drosophila subpulchrella]|uniref:uncharacterized protein LOC119559677 n=1 Tax=Drosophila subpulchrella TaxID=1486046 RepID=UPI0018A13B2E|nr:uncharacterized protein LOC119559677 [Drosophila subpulchrella]
MDRSSPEAVRTTEKYGWTVTPSVSTSSRQPLPSTLTLAPVSNKSVSCFPKVSTSAKGRGSAESMRLTAATTSRRLDHLILKRSLASGLPPVGILTNTYDYYIGCVRYCFRLLSSELLRGIPTWASPSRFRTAQPTVFRAIGTFRRNHARLAAPATESPPLRGLAILESVLRSPAIPATWPDRISDSPT